MYNCSLGWINVYIYEALVFVYRSLLFPSFAQASDGSYWPGRERFLELDFGPAWKVKIKEKYISITSSSQWEKKNNKLEDFLYNFEDNPILFQAKTKH